MRRLLIVLALIAFYALPAFAQDATPIPMSPGDAAAQARTSAEDAARYAGDASRFLDLFQAFGVVLGIVGVALGGFGFARLFSAQNELTQTRKRFEADLTEARKRFDEETAQKERDMQALREQLLQTVEQQHRLMAQTTLALALLPLGERQYKAQDLRGAADTYQRALALDEANPLIHYRLGYVYVQSGSLDDAETHLTRALEIDPEFLLAMAALGYVYRRKGDKLPEGLERDQLMNKGEWYLLEALRQSPKLVDDDSESWWGSLGGLYRRRGQVDQAIYAYEQAAKVTPHSSYPFSNLALLYMAKHDRAKMLNTYKRVERLARGEAMAEVDNYWAYADLLTSRLALNKVDEAEDALISVFDIAPPDSPYALEMLADTLVRLTEALGGSQAAPHIPPYIERIHARINQRT